MARSQIIVPGTDSDRHKDLDKAAAEYVEARDTRMACSEAETATKMRLHSLMKEKGLKEYKIIDASPQLLVTITVEEEVLKVKKLPDVKPDRVPVKDDVEVVEVSGEHVEH